MKYETIDASQIDVIMVGKVPGPPQDWSDDETQPSGKGKGGDTSSKSQADDDPDLPDPAKLH